ncbi:MAG: hypothetical protein LBT05_10920 [Planctomycetaceae bacterium]|nr:hypothetical protein [Planctomycetaceae bacterium]
MQTMQGNTRIKGVPKAEAIVTCTKPKEDNLAPNETLPSVQIGGGKSKINTKSKKADDKNSLIPLRVFLKTISS